MPTSAVIVDRGERVLLANALAPRQFVRLFRNNVSVLPGSELADFDQCTFPGYADQEVTGLWSGPVNDLVGRAVSRLFNLTWTRAAGLGTETVYGWLLYQLPDPDAQLVAGQRFSVPEVLTAAGELVLFSIIAYLLRA